MFKLRFSNPTYAVWKDKKSGSIYTKCMYKCEIYDTLSHEVMDKFNADGITACDPRDEYDEQIGKAMAESKAKRCAYTTVSYLMPCEEGIDEQIDALMEYKMFYAKMRDFRNVENEHFHYLSEKVKTKK